MDTSYSMNPTVEVDLDAVNDFIMNPNFASYLMDELEFAEAAYVLQRLMEAVKADKESVES